MPAEKRVLPKKPAKRGKNRYPKPDQIRLTVDHTFRSLAEYQPGGKYMKMDVSSVRRAIELFPDYVREFREKNPAAYRRAAKILAYEHEMKKKGKGARELRV